MRLQKFFYFYPPGSVPRSQEAANENQTEAVVDGISTIETAKGVRLNPFLSHKNPKTGAWHPPIYSNRRQAELVKIAASYGVEELLPYSPKKTEERLKKRVELGLRVKGTGVGQKVKGHKWERTLNQRLQTRRQAMLNMPSLIEEWKAVS